MFSCILGLYPLNVSSASPSIGDSPNCPQTLPVSPGGQNCPHLSTTDLKCVVNIQPISVTAQSAGSLKTKMCQLSCEVTNANVQ